jgi:cell pole-organizing protein PopZ
MAQLNHEPSMEDILASIKRIIAEDSEAVTRAPRIRREMASVPAPSVVEAPDPVLEPFIDDEPEAVFAAPEPEEEGADVLELTSPIADEIPEPSVVTPVAAAPAPTKATPEAVISLDRLTSDTAAQASRSAFAALSQMQVRAEAGQENSLEGLVSDLLRPMLREWLDRELPALVERLVAAEVSRLAGR